MKKILFVCTGNTCRSPMAAALMNKLLADQKITDIQVDSAGIAARQGEPASVNAVEAVRELGIDMSRHTARQVMREMLKNSDFVYTMSMTHAIRLKSAIPEDVGKIKVLGSGISDPFGGDLNVYKNCRDSLIAAIKILTEQLKD